MSLKQQAYDRAVKSLALIGIDPLDQANKTILDDLMIKNLYTLDLQNSLKQFQNSAQNQQNLAKNFGAQLYKSLNRQIKYDQGQLTQKRKTYLENLKNKVQEKEQSQQQNVFKDRAGIRPHDDKAVLLGKVLGDPFVKKQLQDANKLKKTSIMQITPTQKQQLRKNAKKFLQQQGSVFQRLNVYNQQLKQQLNRQTVQRTSRFRQNPSAQFKFLFDIDNISQPSLANIYAIDNNIKNAQAKKIQRKSLKSAVLKIILNSLKFRNGTLNQFISDVKSAELAKKNVKLRSKDIVKLKNLKQWGGLIIDMDTILNYPITTKKGIKMHKDPQSAFGFTVKNGNMKLYYVDAHDMLEISPNNFSRKMLRMAIQKDAQRRKSIILDQYGKILKNQDQRKNFIQKNIA